MVASPKYDIAGAARDTSRIDEQHRSGPSAAVPQLGIDLWPALQANQSLFGVFMGTQLEKPEAYRAVSRMLELAVTEELEVIVGRAFPLAAAAEAHAYAESRSTLGRVVIVP